MKKSRREKTGEISRNLPFSLVFSVGSFLTDNDGRGRRTRTHDPWFWRPVLYQLSYTPVCIFLQRSILYHSFMQIASLFSKKDKVFFKKEIRLSRSRISSLNFYTYYHVSNTRLIFTLLDPPRAFSASGRDNCS